MALAMIIRGGTYRQPGFIVSRALPVLGSSFRTLAWGILERVRFRLECSIDEQQAENLIETVGSMPISA